MDRADLLQGVRSEVCRRIGFERVQNVDQVMGYGLQDSLVRFGRADVHAPVDHDRVHADDLTRELRGNAQGELGLAAGGRAHQANCRDRIQRS